MIRKGVSRIVLLVGPLAIKLPRWWYRGEPWWKFRDDLVLTGLLGNTLERDRWDRAKRHPDASRWMAPVLACLPFGMALVMRRYRTLFPRRLTDDELSDLPFLNVDNNGDNIAVDRGQLKVVDYGNFDTHLVLPWEETHGDSI